MPCWAITTISARQSGIADSYHLIKKQGWSHLELLLTACGIVYQWIKEPYMEILTQKHSCTTLSLVNHTKTNCYPLYSNTKAYLVANSST